MPLIIQYESLELVDIVVVAATFLVSKYWPVAWLSFLHPSSYPHTTVVVDKVPEEAIVNLPALLIAYYVALELTLFAVFTFQPLVVALLDVFHPTFI